MSRSQPRRTNKKSKKRHLRARSEAAQRRRNTWLENLEPRHLLSASLALVPVSLAEGTTPTITLGTLTSTNTNLVEGINVVTAVAWGDPNHNVTEGNLTPIAGHSGEYTITGKPQSGNMIVYPEDGSYTATVTVNDLIDPANDTAATTSVTVTEDDAMLSANSIQVAEGQAFSGQVATLSDATATANDSFSATVNWGDGTTGAANVAGGGGNYTINAAHTYANEGHYTLTVSASENGVLPNPIATATSTADVAENDLTVTALPVTGAEHQQINTAVATFTDPGAVQTFSTVPGNGDVNPYGVAIVPAGFPTNGILQPGDTLVANFNNAGNTQGTGTTIVRITPSGQISTFYTSPAAGLDTGLVVLKSGYVIVANVPNNGASGVLPGSLQVLDTNGNLLEALSGPPLADPWDLTVNDQGNTAQLFVSNVSGTSGPNGSVWRIDLTTPPASNIGVSRAVQLGSGYNTRLDANAFVVGPGGMAYDAAADTLYVASQAEKVNGTEVGTIFSIANAGTTTTNGSGEGTVVFADAAHLHGPIGLVLAPNGDLITANSDAVNADPKQPSELVEFTKTGQFVGQFSVDPANGGAFGLAIGTVAGEYRLAAVDDNVPNISFYDFQPTSPTVDTYSATINWGDGTSSAGTITFAAGTFTVSGTHTYADDGAYTVGVSASENGISQFFSTALTGSQQVPPVVTNGTGTGSIFLSGDQTTITINSSFGGLQGNATAAHLHNAPAGANGPVAKDANGNNIEFTGVPSAVGGAIPTQSFSVNAAFVNQLLAGNIYENIHTGAFPSGEIRGQFTPSSFATAAATIAEVDASITGETILAGEAVNFAGVVATINDPGSNDAASAYAATINWGDGTTSIGTITGSAGVYSVAGSHTYALAGHYTISLAAFENGITASPIATGTSLADVAETDLAVHAQPIKANENHQFSGAVATFNDAGAVLTFSTVPTNGDVNPYGVAIVPAGFPIGGTLQPGDTLVANFNNAANVQGTGTTITRITASGQQSTFFTGAAKGLDTGLVVLKSGFVVVANVPNAGNGTLAQGSLQVLDADGNVVETISDPNLLADPWDITANDQGNTVQLFVSNVSGTSGPNGSVTRIDLAVPLGGIPQVQSMLRIASGYNTRLDANAFVVGPAGLAYNAATDTLYVASQAEQVSGSEVGTIFSIAHAGITAADSGEGAVVFADPTHLHGPVGLVLAPNGDLITANSDAVNADPNQPSELVEFTTSGQFVGQFSVDSNNGGAFGLAVGTVGGEYRLAAVDDNTSAIAFYDFQPTSPTVSNYSATINWGDGATSAGTIVFANGGFTVNGTHTYTGFGTYPVSIAVTENGLAQLFETTLSGAQQVPPTGSNGSGTGSIFLSEDESTITINSSFSGLSGTATAAHLHNAAAGANGPIATDASGNKIEFAGVPSATSGTVPTQSFAVNSAFVNQLLAGNIYENIHSTVFQEGEVRGQFTPANYGVATANVAEDVITITGLPVTVAENSAFQGNIATFTDTSVAPASVFTATIDWGDHVSTTGTVSLSGGVYAISANHTYAEDGAYAVTVTVTENAGNQPGPTATATAAATVTEDDIAITASSIATGENQLFKGALATFTDPSATAGDAFTAVVDWGDGTTGAASVSGTGGIFTVAGSHTYSEDGTYTIALSVSESGVLPATIATAVATANVAEDDITVTGLPVRAVESTAFSGAVATFTDPTATAGDAFTAEINWGDGVANAGTVTLANGVFTVSGRHTYGDDGQYALGVSVQEKSVNQAGGSQIVSGVATVVNASPEANWADNAFEDLLDREIEPGAMTDFVAAQNAGVSRQALSLFITGSDEYLTDEIDRAYSEFLGRVAEPAGQAFWLAQMRNGLTYEQLEASFIASPEYYQNAGGTNRGWVDKLYFDLLGRQPDTAGENFWVQSLAAGESRFDVALGFTTSDERESIVIAQDYVSLLQRQGTPQEIAGWISAYRGGLSNEDITAEFVASDEYFRVVGHD